MGERPALTMVRSYPARSGTLLVRTSAWISIGPRSQARIFMCIGDDITCPDFEKHKAKFMGELDLERRSFLKSAFAAAGGATALGAGGLSLVTPALAETTAKRAGEAKYHYLPATAETVHWGYFSKLLKPQVEIDSGDYITIEALTHHANDDADLMVKGDPGAESVFYWTKEQKNVDRRGAG